MRELQYDRDHPWNRTSVVDEEAIDHERQIGDVVVTSDVVTVRVAQRVDFDLLADPIGAQARPPRITVGGSFEMTAPQALELADHLCSAAAFAQEIDDHSH